ncbi:MAG: hypothetical protein SAJ12_05930 [Jaaginema sp. PMC 1079.18]|nr:hypothetical protein [Jaaginema sp. PMC 1080.18]MEC4850530.1 hypothetical protein [Jaaginema sp. PMC 1079.18]MEC4865786.1 hypothetical protein [Jaaginema sp. PMC 1078.18]
MLTLLLIENDDLVASYLNHLALGQEINLVETRDIWLGSFLARTLKPDAIAIHLEFQTLEVYKLIKLLKNHNISAQIPLFFISSEADSESQTIALNLGVDRTFVTPLKPSYLLAILHQKLASSGLPASTSY